MRLTVLQQDKSTKDRGANVREHGRHALHTVINLLICVHHVIITYSFGAIISTRSTVLQTWARARTHTQTNEHAYAECLFYYSVAFGIAAAHSNGYEYNIYWEEKETENGSSAVHGLFKNEIHARGEAMAGDIENEVRKRRTKKTCEWEGSEMRAEQRQTNRNHPKKRLTTTMNRAVPLIITHLYNRITDRQSEWSRRVAHQGEPMLRERQKRSNNNRKRRRTKKKKNIGRLFICSDVVNNFVSSFFMMNANRK